MNNFLSGKKPFYKQSEKFYLLLVGIGLLLMGISSLLRHGGLNNRFLDFAAGIGVAAMFFGSVCLIGLQRNPHSARQHKIDRHDERNIKIREKSAFSAFFVAMLSLAAAFVVFLVMDIWLGAMVITSVMALHVGSFLVFVYVNDKKM